MDERPAESTLFDDGTDALRAEYLRLVRVALPAAAAAAVGRAWPIRLDHCFMRVVLDDLFGRPWRDALPGRTAAYRQLSAEQLRRAIDVARSMLADPAGGRVRSLNEQSLRWRGKAVDAGPTGSGPTGAGHGGRPHGRPHGRPVIDSRTRRLGARPPW